MPSRLVWAGRVRRCRCLRAVCRDGVTGPAGGHRGRWCRGGRGRVGCGLAAGPSVQPRSDGCEVHRAFRAGLRAVHPDAGGDSDAAATVTAAYTALRSGVQRGELLSSAMTDRGEPRRPGRGGGLDRMGRFRMRRGERSCGAGRGVAAGGGSAAADHGSGDLGTDRGSDCGDGAGRRRPGSAQGGHGLA